VNWARNKKLHVIKWNSVINEIHTTCMPVNSSWGTCHISSEVKLIVQTEEGTEMLDLCCEWTWLLLQGVIRVSFWGWSIRESNCGNVGHRMMYIQWDQSLKVSMFLWRLWYFSHSWSNGSWGFWFAQRQNGHLKQVRNCRDLIHHSYLILEFGELIF
jgi:hypothetical protein